MKIFFLLVVSLVSLCSAMEDTQENRSIQADRYLKANPPSEDFAEMASVIAKSVPEYDRERFLTAMPKNLDLDALTKNFKELLVKTFTADELKIFADFYSLPEARTAIKKMGKYMEERRIPFDIAIRNAMRKTAEENRAVQPPPTPDKK